MTPKEISQVIIDIITEVVPEEDCSNLLPGEPLREQLELDSMDFLDIVMELRKNYGVEVPESDYGELASLDSCVAYLTPKLADK